MALVPETPPPRITTLAAAGCDWRDTLDASRVSGVAPASLSMFGWFVAQARRILRQLVSFVAGDYVTVHMNFTGHFTGKFGEVQGKGQAISFIATDLIKVTNGRVSDNWHIEDNLTLKKQLGVVVP